jgi:AraC-like DNA-binding protein
MNNDIHGDDLVLGKHQFGRVDHRMKVGPVKWPFHDLFWVHEGVVKMDFPDIDAQELLEAPAGVLILPGTFFLGQAAGTFATASICHFEYKPAARSQTISSQSGSQGYLVAPRNEGLHIQNQLRLAMQLAQQDDHNAITRRKRLLLSILDGFAPPKEKKASVCAMPVDRFDTVWQLTCENLNTIRTLSDVARLAGVSESGFRARHRAVYNASAGGHLRELRLTQGEQLLATTGFSVSEIALQVGYRHGESFCNAFKKSRRMTPRQYRRWSKPFA